MPSSLPGAAMLIAIIVSTIWQNIMQRKDITSLVATTMLLAICNPKPPREEGEGGIGKKPET